MKRNLRPARPCADGVNSVDFSASSLANEAANVIQEVIAAADEECP
jgi:hypothetical protein